jgi:hypothetical protein
MNFNELIRMNSDERLEFNRTCDDLCERMSAEEACVYLARSYSRKEKMAFMMGSALTLSLLGDGVLTCPSLIITRRDIIDDFLDGLEE